MLSLQRAAHLVREGQGNPANITWELWNERRKVSNIHRESPLQDSRVVGSAGNGSGTAEVSPLSLIGGIRAIFCFCRTKASLV